MGDEPRGEVVQPVDQALERLVRFEASLTRLRWALLVVAAVAVIAASGWWLSSRDRSATIRHGTVADCQSLELARTLDQFQVIVAPDATAAQRSDAGRELARMGTLGHRYQACESASS